MFSRFFSELCRAQLPQNILSARWAGLSAGFGRIYAVEPAQNCSEPAAVFSAWWHDDSTGTHSELEFYQTGTASPYLRLSLFFSMDVQYIRGRNCPESCSGAWINRQSIPRKDVCRKWFVTRPLYLLQGKTLYPYRTQVWNIEDMKNHVPLSKEVGKELAIMKWCLSMVSHLCKRQKRKVLLCWESCYIPLMYL